MVSRRLSREAGHRRKFLAIIDDTPECERAVAYASKRAKSTGGVLVLLYVIEPGDFQHWLGVEKIMRDEAIQTAGAALDVHATKVRERIGIEPESSISRGVRACRIESRSIARVRIRSSAAFRLSSMK